MPLFFSYLLKVMQSFQNRLFLLFFFLKKESLIKTNPKALIPNSAFQLVPKNLRGGEKDWLKDSKIDRMNQCSKLLGVIRNTSKQKIQQAFSQLAKQQYHVKPMQTLFPSRLLLLQNPRKFGQPFTAYDFLGKRGYARLGIPRGNRISKNGDSKKKKRVMTIVPSRGSNYGIFDGYGSYRCPDYSYLEEKVKDFLRRIKFVAEIVWFLLLNAACITFGTGYYFLHLQNYFSHSSVIDEHVRIRER